jgi:hypothetical protein
MSSNPMEAATGVATLTVDRLERVSGRLRTGLFDIAGDLLVAA